MQVLSRLGDDEGAMALLQEHGSLLRAPEELLREQSAMCVPCKGYRVSIKRPRSWCASIRLSMQGSISTRSMS